MEEMNDLEELQRALDATTTAEREWAVAREDAIWSTVVERSATRRKKHHRHRRQLVGGIAVVAVAAALVIGLLPAARPTNAAAAVLSRAETRDAAAASLPVLTSGEYYYQSSNVQLYCGFSGANLATHGSYPLINYVTTGVRQSWTSGSGEGDVVLTANPTGVDGSGFASPADQTQWIAEGEPNNPCNPAEPDNGALSGGFAYFGGFGFMFQDNSTQQTDAGNAVNQLPSNVSTLSQLLADGEINPDATTSSTPQVCPIVLFAPGATVQPTQPFSSGPTGCSQVQQVSLVLALLQLPDASNKLGAALYQLLSHMPGTTLAGTTQVNGVNGTLIQLPLGAGETVGVVIEASTGSLLQTSVTIQQGDSTASTSPINDVVTYGSISVVQGISQTPSSS